MITISPLVLVPITLPLSLHARADRGAGATRNRWRQHFDRSGRVPDRRQLAIVHLASIDTPELNGTCPVERRRGEAETGTMTSTGYFNKFREHRLTH
ncbi:MAG: hypothetical protein ACREB3_11555 [Burkholderiales bacterium]